jgi:hypothetical protein
VRECGGCGKLPERREREREEGTHVEQGLMTIADADVRNVGLVDVCTIEEEGEE